MTKLSDKEEKKVKKVKKVKMKKMMTRDNRFGYSKYK
jgi:hypothetical protein